MENGDALPVLLDIQAMMQAQQRAHVDWQDEVRARWAAKDVQVEESLSLQRASVERQRKALIRQQIAVGILILLATIVGMTIGLWSIRRDFWRREAPVIDDPNEMVQQVGAATGSVALCGRYSARGR